MNPLRGDTAAPPPFFSAIADEGGAFQRFLALAAALEALGCSVGSSWGLLSGLWGLFGGLWGALGSSWAVLGVAFVHLIFVFLLETGVAPICLLRQPEREHQRNSGATCGPLLASLARGFRRGIFFQFIYNVLKKDVDARTCLLQRLQREQRRGFGSSLGGSLGQKELLALRFQWKP